MRRTIMVVPVAVVLLAAGACGGESRLSRQEFVEEGNAICKDGADRIDEAAAKAFAGATEEDPTTVEDVTAFARETAIPEIDRQLDALAGLKPPKDAQAGFDEAMKEARSALAKAEADPALIADDADTTFGKANRLIKAAGLDACAE